MFVHAVRNGGGVRQGLRGLTLALLVMAAAPHSELVITGQVLYGSAEAARQAAVVDIHQVYDQNPAYMRMKALGLSEGSSRGRALFDEARAGTNRALARVALDHGLDVITVPGGVEGAEVPDLSADVITRLPLHCIEGNVLHGRGREAQRVGEVDSLAVLNAIPAYVESLGLDENDARYHILRKHYLDAFADAIRRTASEQQMDALVEKGGVTSRLGPVPDLTRATIAALTL